MWKEKFIQYLRYERNYSSLTEISYLNDLTQFQKFIETECGAKEWNEIDSDMIRIWISQLMEEGMKARSVNRKLSALKSFFRYLKKKDVVKINPAAQVSGPKITKRLPTFVSNDDLSKVIDDPLAFEDNFRGHRDRFLIELFYLTGMRKAELISLKDSDIDFTNNTLRVTGKRNKQRLIPFTNETKEKLNQYIEKRNQEIANKSPFLFVKEDGEPLYPRLVYNIINNHLNSIPTLSKKSPHVLRHSFATGMLNNGAEIMRQRTTWTRKPASTEIYACHRRIEKASHRSSKSKNEGGIV